MSDNITHMLPKIEQVARAIGEAKAEDEPPLQYVLIRGYTAMGYALPSGAAIDAVNAAARAAIEAMRKPTQRMRDAAARKGWNPEGGQDIEECWPAMIDAALAEPPK